MTLLFYTLGFMVIGLTLFAFVRKPVLLQTMHPALNGVVTRLTSRRAKYAYLGFYYLFSALAKMLLLLVGGALAFFAVKSDESEETQIDSNGNFWYRSKGGNWYTHSPDEDSTEPWV